MKNFQVMDQFLETQIIIINHAMPISLGLINLKKIYKKKNYVINKSDASCYKCNGNSSSGCTECSVGFKLNLTNLYSY